MLGSEPISGSPVFEKGSTNFANNNIQMNKNDKINNLSLDNETVHYNKSFQCRVSSTRYPGTRVIGHFFNYSSTRVFRSSIEYLKNHSKTLFLEFFDTFFCFFWVQYVPNWKLN